MGKKQTYLKKAMDESGVSADELHAAVGGHRNDVNQWISGARDVPAIRCQAVIDFIKCPWLTIYHLRSDCIRLKHSA